jgi:hypothetical protein
VTQHCASDLICPYETTSNMRYFSSYRECSRFSHEWGSSPGLTYQTEFCGTARLGLRDSSKEEHLYHHATRQYQLLYVFQLNMSAMIRLCWRRFCTRYGSIQSAFDFLVVAMYHRGLWGVVWVVRWWVNPQGGIYMPMGGDTFFSSERWSGCLVNFTLGRFLRVTWTGLFEWSLEKWVQTREGKKLVEETKW